MEPVVLDSRVTVGKSKTTYFGGWTKQICKEILL